MGERERRAAGKRVEGVYTERDSNLAFYAQ